MVRLQVPLTSSDAIRRPSYASQTNIALLFIAASLTCCTSSGPLELKPLAMERQQAYPEQPVSTPKIALLFLVTTHVKHEELWGQWLHLSWGLKLGEGFPMPSPNIDLDSIYGPAHAHAHTHASIITRRSRKMETPERTLGTRKHQNHDDRSVSKEDSNSSASGASEPHALTAEEFEAKAWLEGRNPDVKQIYTSQSLFTIYVHSTPGHQHSKPSIFTGREIPDLVDVTNAYGQHALMKAEKALLKEALKNTDNVKFMLVGHDAVPLYPSYVFWAQLMSEGDMSRLSFLSAATTDKGWLQAMEGAHLKAHHFGTASQWFVLTRTHAMLVARDVLVEQKFEQLCGRGNQNCVSDETYIPTLLATYNAIPEVDGCGCATHVVFQHQQWSPHSYVNSEINSSLFSHLRLGYNSNCAWEAMVKSAQAIFQAWADESSSDAPKHAQLDEENQKLGSRGLGPLGRWLKAAGLHAMHTHCPLMARKFPSERKNILLKTLFDCDGGLLASSCRHPTPSRERATGADK